MQSPGDVPPRRDRADCCATAVLVLFQICFSGVAAFAQTPGPRTIVFPESAATAACSVVSADGQRAGEPQRGRITVACGTTGTIVCEGAGIEPLDLPIDAACRLPELPLRAASDVPVARDTAAPITVEWLSLAADGAITTLARRMLSDDQSSSLAVANVPDRWIRFHTPGRAPLTVPVATLLTAQAFRVPELRPGGELVIVFDRPPLPPQFYRLTGPYATELRDSGPIASLHGLPSGDYLLHPVYDGPNESAPFAMTVAPAASTLKVLKLHAVGAVVVTVDPEICSGAEEFRVSIPVRGIVEPPGLVRTREIGACRWVVGGLPPNLLEASVWSARGVSGRQSFRAVENQLVQVTVAPAPVTVSGRVLVNEQPPENAFILFSGIVGMQTQVRPDGTYDVALDREGEYNVFLTGTNRLRKETKATLHRGSNTLDFIVDDAAANTRLTVRVKPVDASAPIAVEVRPAGSAEVLLPRIPPGEQSTTLRGLPLGVHRVIARQPTATSEWTTVELSATQLEATVDLVLTRGSRSITLRDPDGELVTEATFTNLSPAPEQLTPGMYSLGMAAPGSELQFRVPFGAPLCRIVHAEGNVDVMTAAGRAITLLFQDPRLTVNDVRLSSAGPLDCPVPLTRFLKTPLGPGPGGTRTLEVLNAPAGDLLIIHTPAATYRFDVPLDGRLVVPR